jgi:hypothetical protein
MLSTLSMAQWESLIRAIATDSGRILFTRHAKERMRQRSVTYAQVLEVLQRGVIRREPEPDIKTGHMLCRMERHIAGRSVGAVVALQSVQADSGAVVTVMLIGE